MLVEPDMADGGGVPAQTSPQRAVGGRGDRQSRCAGDGLGDLDYGLVIGVDVLGEFGRAELVEALGELPGRPAVPLAVGAEAAPGQPSPDGGWLGEQGEVAHVKPSLRRRAMISWW